MGRFLLFIVSILGFVEITHGQYSLSGKVINSKKHTPIAFAMVSIPEQELWATANAKGEFEIRNVPAGKMAIQVEYLGFQRKTFEIDVNRNIDTLHFLLEEFSLLLKEVTVTAKRKTTSLTTSYLIDRSALDHLQMLNVADATSLLPGGKTNRVQHLATDGAQMIAVNGMSGEMGNAIFGVALEVDGVRISNNAIPGVTGTDTRNIASSNVESIEIVTGIPSVEHGDMTNGMVRINTRKGKSPYIIELMTKPNTKQVAAAKGFGLGDGNGVLNVNLEHTRSVSDLASPYTSYARNGLSLNYSNTFSGNKKQPLFLDIGLAGNIGGFNSKSDPDQFVNTYSKVNDHVLRGKLSVKWMLNKPWITNIELSGGVNYNDQLRETSKNQSASASVAALHTTEAGYRIGQTYNENPDAGIILIEPGYWYELSFDDSKALNYTGRIKANWNRTWGSVNNNLLIGGQLDKSSNSGRGTYYDDMRYAPTWREYRYDQFSNIGNYALFVEDKVHIPLGQSAIRLVAGVRSDITAVDGSEYGAINSLSPRFNGEYVFWEKSKRKVRDLILRVGWGKAVKLPSFGALYPELSYRDYLTFAPGTTSDGKTFYAYYTMPSTRIYTPDLKWQSNIQSEISLLANIDGTRIMVTAAQDRTYDPYISTNIFAPFTYKFTDQSNLQNSNIPIADRIYSVDQHTGIVSITDKTGARPAETVSYKEFTRFIGNDKTMNGSSVLRRRLSWIVDFKEIRSIRTSFRIDGNYYYYEGVERTVSAHMPNTAANMADGNPYKYVGFYTGGNKSANGTLTKSLSVNLTGITHIPSIRLILSARLECSLYDYDLNLSESGNGSRGFVLDNKDDYTPSPTKMDIYGSDRFVGVYPDYYISLDDMTTPIPFAENFLWAKTNDPALYNELAKMVIKSPRNYYFNPNRVSFYYSANLGITKEIGRVVSITFNATNFINNMSKVRFSRGNGEITLFGSSYIPAFYYGLSCRFKI